MDNKILEEIIRLNKDKTPFCTVSKINDDNVEIIISDERELTDIQKLVQDALLKDQLIIINYKGEELITLSSGNLSLEAKASLGSTIVTSKSNNFAMLLKYCEI